MIHLPDPNPLTPEPCSCGGQAWLKKHEKPSGDYFSVRCIECGKEGPWKMEGVEAVEAWNGEQEE